MVDVWNQILATEVPEAAVGCATTKKMLKPGTPQSSCAGEKFTAILAHAGEKRVTLLRTQRRHLEILRRRVF